MRLIDGQPEIPDGDVTRFVGKLWEAIPPTKRDSLYEALGDSEMIILRASVPQLVSPLERNPGLRNPHFADELRRHIEDIPGIIQSPEGLAKLLIVGGICFKSRKLEDLNT